ncbi:unnamed protein product [Ostreobium quekettii]|uniref:Thioredoxin domain-containing protein n=1 Tax=Ostreobium quekettii TaxID=121088 RepID=A0A8S1ITC6_9CHLO|nr:unnamed protein product [Ostreobium quekettii]|eukprot:evm.model.scf_766EXC.1 EVM.evm.TU.scf_766EXC.1   scf_766EXC:3641-7489(+)
MPTKFLARLKAVDFYKKLPSDLSEATLAGAWISIGAAIVISVLLGLEFFNFMQVQTQTELVVDRSRQGELLRINFNISFPALSCEFATLDVSDALGTKKINLTKTLRKTPLDFDGNWAGLAEHDRQLPEPKYDDEMPELDDVDISLPLTEQTFEWTLQRYPIVFVNFYAPWCPWCQRMEPSWEAATKQIHDKYPESDGRIRMAKVDCTAQNPLCMKHGITGFPSMRVYRKGHDEIYTHGLKDHEAYTGHRTVQAFVAFVESLVPSAGKPHTRHANLKKVSKHAGCNLAGFVLVKKVPGTLHFLAKSSGHHSFDNEQMNMTHHIHHFYFGSRPSPYRYKFLQKLHPLGLQKDWADKLQDDNFFSVNPLTTHEHALQAVLTTIEAGSGSTYTNYDAYEYTVHSHAYVDDTDAIPASKFSYSLSPIQIVVRETQKHWYRFLTSTCAIVGGVFTVAGILDSVVYQGVQLAKKAEIGKLS